MSEFAKAFGQFDGMIINPASSEGEASEGASGSAEHGESKATKWR